MSELEQRLASTSGEHRAALEWFLAHAGEEVGWPQPLPSGQLVVNKAKGIHKPAGWGHALSVRQSLGGPYDDKEVYVRSDGTWRFDYYQEGSDPSRRDDDYTNRALMQNSEDGIPVGVLIQVKKKPNPRYRVLGLAAVTGWVGGYFTLEGFNAQGQLAARSKPSDTDQIALALETPPLDLTDARKRINAAIIARQGANAYRKAALDAFQGRCAITGCEVVEVLEAAHIVPYLGTGTNQVTNTLLLRADIHTLFDRGLLSVAHDSLQVWLAPSLRDTSYAGLEGKSVTIPTESADAWRARLRQRKEIGIG